MAVKIFTATTGALFWSTASNWSGSTAPTSNGDDDVYANGKTIYFDSNVNVSILTTATAPVTGGLAGGTFNHSGSTTLNITATNFIANNTPTAGIRNLSTGTLNIFSPIISGGSTANGTTTNVGVITNQSTGTLNISGVTLNAGATANNHFVYNTVGGAVNITGDVRSNLANGVINVSNGALSIVGNIIAGTGASNLACIANNGNANLRIVGNYISGGTAYAITIGGTLGSINISVNSIHGGTAGGAVNNSVANTNVNITGNVYSCKVTGAFATILNAAAGVINVSGASHESGTSGGIGEGFRNTLGGTIRIIGNIVGSSTSNSPATVSFIRNGITAPGNSTIFITGNVITQNVGAIASPAANAGVIYNENTNSNLYIVGNVNGGTVANAVAITNASTGGVYITGSVSGGTNATLTPAINNVSSGIVDVSNAIAGTAYPAIISTNVSARNIIRSGMTYTNGISPYYAYRIQSGLSTSAQTITAYDTNNNYRVLSTSGYTSSLPNVTDVRSGTTYGAIGNRLTGTMAVPTSGQTSLGVPVDNTRGSAVLSITDMSALLRSFLTK
jgi:hypothetical protein